MENKLLKALSNFGLIHFEHIDENIVDEHYYVIYIENQVNREKLNSEKALILEHIDYINENLLSGKIGGKQEAVVFSYEDIYKALVDLKLIGKARLSEISIENAWTNRMMTCESYEKANYNNAKIILITDINMSNKILHDVNEIKREDALKDQTNKNQVKESVVVNQTISSSDSTSNNNLEEKNKTIVNDELHDEKFISKIESLITDATLYSNKNSTNENEGWKQTGTVNIENKKESNDNIKQEHPNVKLFPNYNIDENGLIKKSGKSSTNTLSNILLILFIIFIIIIMARSVYLY